ncbi:potassium transport protein 1 [Westerdykella ornata]|uniref:Potassium transport protein 1 n=1 Tax=Westerdykella ornata TaxID=318751 RepID=A0A6A6JG94_WESOR|nr:potassium transport protein 1 [Westerdykella ornata]KAF2274229.1 potassium transport protein 1 [Westerdykella ornata]
MWLPPRNFITLHYAYIIIFGILGIVILYPFGNLTAIDAYFMGVSASTESGLNTVDVKAMKTYQQLFLYFAPLLTNLGFINMGVILVRLRWFRQRFKGLEEKKAVTSKLIAASSGNSDLPATSPSSLDSKSGQRAINTNDERKSTTPVPVTNSNPGNPHITFAPEPYRPTGRDDLASDEEDGIQIKPVSSAGEGYHSRRRRKSDTRSMSRVASVDRAVSSVFVLGSTASRASHEKIAAPEPIDLVSLTSEELGGTEYNALRVLLKLTCGYFFGLHLFGVLCLLPWIHTANPKYKEYLASQGQDITWWAFYSAQTMVNNLGLTLTPDSMTSFRDATWPMLVMSFLAFAGNTFYPVFLRLVIWITYKLSPATSTLKETLRFLLDHPRRCYTLLFPSTTTWALATILVTLNFIDVLLIITLDLDNPELTALSPGPRILAAIFQAASSRHTGTATFNIANVNPAVQLSLLVMMYISVFPIAMSIRMSGTYEERSVGIYGAEDTIDERRGSKTYLISLMRNQLSFDLWYIFLGVFCICIAESKRIMSREDWAFSIFSILFEVVSAYANVGLSLGYPTNLTSLSGHFSTFSKVVICFTMIRGRHRGLPYALDRAVTLPIDRLAERDEETDLGKQAKGAWKAQGRKMVKAYTQ